MLSYILAAVVGALIILFGINRKNKAEDENFRAKTSKLDDTLTQDKTKAQQAQETADELTQKFDEELRDYQSNKPGSNS